MPYKNKVAYHTQPKQIGYVLIFRIERERGCHRLLTDEAAPTPSSLRRSLVAGNVVPIGLEVMDGTETVMPDPARWAVRLDGVEPFAEPGRVTVLYGQNSVELEMRAILHSPRTLQAALNALPSVVADGCLDVCELCPGCFEVRWRLPRPEQRPITFKPECGGVFPVDVICPGCAPEPVPGEPNAYQGGRAEILRVCFTETCLGQSIGWQHYRPGTVTCSVQLGTADRAQVQTITIDGGWPESGHLELSQPDCNGQKIGCLVRHGASGGEFEDALNAAQTGVRYRVDRMVSGWKIKACSYGALPAWEVNAECIVWRKGMRGVIDLRHLIDCKGVDARLSVLHQRAEVF